MTANVWWDTQCDNVLVYKFSDQWTWDDFYRSLNDEVNALADMDARYDSIGDFLDTDHLPDAPNFTIFKNIAQKRRRTSHGLMVIVTTSAFIRMMIANLGRIYPETANAFVTASSYDEAYRMVAASRAGVEQVWRVAHTA